MIFEGIMTGGVTCDMAIDDIQVDNQPCQAGKMQYALRTRRYLHFALKTGHGGSVDRAPASSTGGRGSEPRPSHTKNNGTFCLLARRSAY